MVVGPNTTPQNRLVRTGSPPLINNIQAISQPMWDSLTHPLMPTTIVVGAWI